MPDPTDDATIEVAILGLLSRRKGGATICPSEVARALATGPVPWRDMMPRVRAVADAMALADRLTVTRHGEAVRATSQGGPIRLGLPARDV